MIDDKKRTDERIKKEIEKRDNMRKTFKGVVGREKEKWEKNTVHTRSFKYGLFKDLYFCGNTFNAILNR